MNKKLKSIIVTPSQVSEKIENERCKLNNMITQANDADKAQLMSARETLTRIARLAPRVHAGFLGVAMAMLGMCAWNLIDKETHNKASIAVYAAMIMFVMYNALLSDKLAKQKALYEDQKNKVAKNSR